MKLDVETIVVGAGISGIGTAIEILRNRMRSFVVLEKADELGGTWRDNDYPGVAVDIPSISYSFAFELDYPWSRTYAPGAEILAYLKHCSRKYGVDDYIRYGVDVVRVEFDAATNTWTTVTANGKTYRSRYVIAATGLFGAPKMPDIPGLDTFGGKLMHTALWDHDYALAGKRVGMIGTGASAVQVVPSIAGEVKSLTVFQRTPIWVGPKRDVAIDRQKQSARWLRVPALRVRRAISELILQIASFFAVNYRKHKGLTRRIEAQLERYLRNVVDDPALHKALLPAYGLGCKRPAVSNEYLQSFNRSNVELVTTAIDTISPAGVVTSDGAERALDTLILGTGFQTFEKGNAPRFAVVGLDGVELGDYWQRNRYQSYMGIAMPGFPNFFLTMGPYSGGLNWFTMLNDHLIYILRCMKRAHDCSATRVEIRQSEHDKYFALMLDEAEDAVYKEPACVTSRSYYIDSHGDASLGLPMTPWWRSLYVRYRNLGVFSFEK